MNLNPDCVRDILIYLEDNLILFDDDHRVCRNEIGWRALAEDDNLNKKYLIDDIRYTVIQFSEAGFIVGKPVTGGRHHGIGSFDILDITWAGHELLASLRGEELWAATKSVADRLGTYSIKALSTIASAVISAKINQYFQGGAPL